ncbi:MAG: LamB/YcsF family protein [Fimbriimonadales bacterium]|nr:LamB/YcsF family protein [Fimbriimonadales bacterium]
MGSVDLNVDVAEGFPFDRELLRVATSANVACGEHAGSTELARETAILCRDLGVVVGAHPGYPDRARMGREPWPSPAAAWDSLQRQVELLMTLGACYLKPHGALYNQSCDPGPAAELLARLVEKFRLPLIGLAATEHERVAREVGVPFAREGFADRRLLPNGRLAPRSEPGAVLHRADEVVANAISLAPSVDAICLHGDTPGCVELARGVRRGLEAAGWRIEPWL